MKQAFFIEVDGSQNSALKSSHPFLLLQSAIYDKYVERNFKIIHKKNFY